jgi:type II secretory pathway component GspD/PulD (secretin)
MNRTLLSHRVAVLAIVAVLACGWLRTGNAQTFPQSPPEPKVFRVFGLRYVEPGFAASALQRLLGDDEMASVRMTAGSDGTLLMYAPPEAYKKILDVIKAIDVAPAREPEAQIKVFTLVHSDPVLATQVLSTLLPKGTRVAVDQRTRSLVASGSRDALAIAEAVLTRLDVEANRERPKSDANYEVRIALLANDASGAPPAGDLKDVVAELSRLGVKDPRQFGQMVVQTSSGQSFQLSSLPDFIGGPPLRLTASGRLLQHNEGAVEMDISIRAVVTRDAHGEERNLSDLHTRIVAPQRQYVVLATAPVGKMTLVFVVQVTERPSVGQAKQPAPPQSSPF